MVVGIGPEQSVVRSEEQVRAIGCQYNVVDIADELVGVVVEGDDMILAGSLERDRNIVEDKVMTSPLTAECSRSS